LDCFRSFVNGFHPTLCHLEQTEEEARGYAFFGIASWRSVDQREFNNLTSCTQVA
jgi:hypothetical protein